MRSTRPEKRLHLHKLIKADINNVLEDIFQNSRTYAYVQIYYYMQPHRVRQHRQKHYFTGPNISENLHKISNVKLLIEK